jgi:hypothetical protein
MSSYNSFDWKIYVKNYPDLKEAGINNCEQAWNHYQRFGKNEGRIYKSINNEIINSTSIKYKILYKMNNSYIIDFSNVYTFRLNDENIKMYSSTPCITEVDDGYILNIRYVNYIIKEHDPVYTYSLNKHVKLDKSFIKSSEHFHEYSFKEDSLKHKGLEDIKIFNDSGTLYYIGNIFRLKKSCITSGIFNGTFELNVIKTTFTDNKSWEKNWCFVKYQNKVCLVYNWFPIRICSINYLLKSISVVKEIRNVPSLFENVRGSTNGYTFQNEIWFITHLNKNGEYHHLFVVFDLDMNLKRYSEYFKFENYTIEFCLGLIVEPTRFIISYSTNDSSSKLIILKNIDLTFYTV